MSSEAIRVVVESGLLTTRTQTGFGLLNARAGVETSRGFSSPSENHSSSLGLIHQQHIKQIDAHAVELWQTLRNTASEPLDITRITLLDGLLALDGAGWRAAHSELFRRDRYAENFNFYTGSLLVPSRELQGCFGTSEDHPFPGLIFTHPERGTVLMGTLTQRRCKPRWDVTRTDGQSRLVATDWFSGTTRIRVKSGGEFETERWILLFVPGSMHDAIDSYYEHLRTRMTFRGANSVLRHAPIWGSWNHNPRPRGYWDITHDYIVSNAHALVKMTPNRPRVVMIDDGYQRGKAYIKSEADWFATWLENYYGSQNPEEMTQFPHGMGGTAKAIKDAGALAAIWATPRITRQSQLALDHPDWLLQRNDGQPFGKLSAFLDYSLPEVRQFTKTAWETVFHRWGYQAMKLDFWSIQFEPPQVEYRNPDMTAVELRNLYLSDLRSFVPDGGYIIAAVPTNSGNPFMGQHVDATRMGVDISYGRWDNIIDSATSITGVIPFVRHDCLLGDADSIGWCPQNTPGQNRMWAAMSALGGSVCEISGDLTNLSPEADEMMRSVISRFGPRRRTLIDVDSGIGGVPPWKLTVETDAGIQEAHFNWTNFRREVRVDSGRKDAWSKQVLEDLVKIPPREALWLDVPDRA